MKLKLSSAPPARTELAVGLVFDGARPKLADHFEAAVRAARATGDVESGARKVSLFYPASGKAKRLAFVGLGAKSNLDAEGLRRAAAVAQARAEALGVKEFQLWMDAADCGRVPPATAARALAEGMMLGAYRYQPPRKEKPEARSGQRATIIYHGKDKRAFADGLALGIAQATGTLLARELGDTPGNICTPRYLAAQARKLAAPHTKVRILDEREMARLKMMALLGVSRGSTEPARLIVLDHRPAHAERTVCVVGKGLTFDSGGISIKPSSKMDEMRYDMCGGAAVLGMFSAIKAGALKGACKKTRVVGVVAASENMPDGSAQKPGDVVRANDGTTIEILNTDAEGRLILADALAYANKTYKPAQMVDLATLTGAVVVALGHEVTGVMGNDDKLVKAIIRAAEDGGEPAWQLPMWQVHLDQVKSRNADVANLNSPAHGNGSTAGGAFLSYFVGKTPWLHLDIAGTAWGGISRDYYRSGASGVGVRTLVQWLRSFD